MLLRLKIQLVIILKSFGASLTHSKPPILCHFPMIVLSIMTMILLIILQTFSNQFTNAVSSVSERIAPVHDLHITNINITMNEIFIHLNRLNLNSTPDMIKFLVRSSERAIISCPKWTLFNKSLSSSIFLKLCTVIPIFKGGDRCQISNYRLISK